ncbi:putative protein [Arabidopsis thaliana]|uniref:Uncharacterized protein F24G16.50 n=1 Tax=Arabidopsis thaliana TaxID=3702 RepID=Q9M1Z6_ARATH|nr:putative protein [Arabidopsis thaliana]
MSEAFVASDEGLTYVENGEDVFPVEAVAADVSPVEAVVPDVSPIECLSAETLTDKTSSLIDSVESGTNATVKISPDSSVSLPDAKASFDDFSSGLKQSFSSSLPDAKASVDDFSSGVKESFSSSLNQGENAVKNTLESFSSSVTSITKNASEVVDSAVNRAFSTLDQTGDVAGDKFSSFSTGLKEASNRAAVIAIDLLRQSVSLGERSVTNGVSFVVYSYGSAKELLPPDVKSALNSSEDVALKVLSPVGAVLQQYHDEQVSVAIGGLERNIGLDPDDPILHLFLFVGTTGTFWVLYRVWTYGGYAGDLSPKSTLDLLKSRDKSVLIDVRPEALREKDGIPDLRRSARFRYSSVTLPEVGFSILIVVDHSEYRNSTHVIYEHNEVSAISATEVDGDVKRLLKGGSEVDDILTAVIIKNLKIVQDRSKVVVMDADGTRSKGGYRSWVQEGLRVKEPKPETTLTILNEEAEAIFEDINPSPLQLFGVEYLIFSTTHKLLTSTFCTNMIALSLAEWEKTLQLIAVIGLSLFQTLCRLYTYDFLHMMTPKTSNKTSGIKAPSLDPFSIAKTQRNLCSVLTKIVSSSSSRLLLAPVKLGAQAFSWAAGKLETNGVGLPTSPSSSDVRSRVLQAAAKHESKPSDETSESLQDASSSPEEALNNVDVSEA